MVVIFSVFDIILGMTSVGVQVKYTFSISVKYHFLIFLHLCNNVQRENSKLAALILYTRISNFVDVNYDVVAHSDMVRIYVHWCRKSGSLLFIQSPSSVKFCQPIKFTV
jgi:hypothetical protein